jgi:hypothetical protein
MAPMSHPYRPESPNRKPALWLPGVLCVEGGLVRLGSLAGWRAARGIDDWKRSVVVVDKQHVAEEDRPEHRLERFPRLKQAALACPLVAYTADWRVSLMDQGMMVYEVGWHRVSGGGHLTVEGIGEPERGVGGELYGLPVLSLDGKTPPDGDRAAPSVDQILRALSGGQVTEEAVELATDLLDVLDAHRSETVREPQLEHWELWLEQRFIAAAPFEEEIRALARALSTAPPGERIPVPFYGEAGRVRVPSMVIGCSDAPDEKETLELPAVELFEVASVGEPVGSHLFFAPRWPRRSRAGVWWTVAAVTAVALWLVLRGR